MTVHFTRNTKLFVLRTRLAHEYPVMTATFEKEKKRRKRSKEKKRAQSLLPSEAQNLISFSPACLFNFTH